MGEVANGSTHYHVLFFIGLVLFLISLAVNIAASSVVFRIQETRREGLVMNADTFLLATAILVQRLGISLHHADGRSSPSCPSSSCSSTSSSRGPAISWEFLTGLPATACAPAASCRPSSDVLSDPGHGHLLGPAGDRRRHLPVRICPGELADPSHPHRDHQPGRHPLGGLWLVWSGLVRALPASLAPASWLPR